MLLGGCKRGEMGLVWTELGVNGRALKENEQKEKGTLSGCKNWKHEAPGSTEWK